jgi:hypothetical protein
MKRIPVLRRPVTHPFKRPHSKAEEPDYLFRRNPPSVTITTQPLKKGKRNLPHFTITGNFCVKFYWMEKKAGKRDENLKLPAHRARLPGKVISFYIVPLDPPYPARAGRGTFRSIDFHPLTFALLSRLLISPLSNHQILHGKSNGFKEGSPIKGHLSLLQRSSCLSSSGHAIPQKHTPTATMQ